MVGSSKAMVFHGKWLNFVLAEEEFYLQLLTGQIYEWPA